MTMAREKRASQAPSSNGMDASERPVVLGELLGVSRDRRSGTRIEPADGRSAPATPGEAATSVPPPSRRRAGQKNLLILLMFAAIAACGVFVGVQADSIGDALRTVSVVLVITAVLIYLTALLFWLRGRRRPGRARGAEAAAASPVVPPRVEGARPGAASAPTSSPKAPVATGATPVPGHPADVGAGGPPRVPTLAEVAAQLDAARGVRPSEAAPPAPVRAVAVPVPAPAPVAPVASPVPAAPAPAAPVVPPPPMRAPVVVAAPVAEPEPVVETPASVVPRPPAPAPSRAELTTDSSTEVIHAIAPYAQVVGAPVIRERVIDVAAQATAGTPSYPVAAEVARAVPPPPAPRAAAVPPPPPPSPAAVVPPPPPASPASPARSAAEVFAAMAAAAPAPSVPPPPPVSPASVPPASAPVVDVHPGVALGDAHLDRTAGEFVDLFAGERTAEVVPMSPLTPAADAPGWTPPPTASEVGMVPHVATADMTARSAVGSVAPVIVYRYRKWVLGQMMPGAAFGPVDVDRSPDEWLLLATCGVATLLAWTHEDHHFTYPVETWAEEILPAHGVRIRDRELAKDLLLAAALHAGGVDSVPTERLRMYEPADLVTAMASIHVGLLRLYCGLGRIGPERVLADQYGIGPGDIPLH